MFSFQDNSYLISILVGLNVILALILFDVPLSSDANSVKRTADRIDVSSLDRSQFSELKKVSEYTSSFKKLTDFFEDIAEEKGAEYAYNVLRLSDLPPGTDLHLLGHAVGDVLFKQQGLKGIHVCTQDFRNACSHTIVIGLFYQKGEGALSDISNTCRGAPGGKGAYTMCFHGLGHGVLSYAGYDLEKAVDLCSQTATPEYNGREFNECVGGTIMEIIGGVHDREAWSRAHKKYFKDDDPLYPCSADFIPDRIKSICYNYLTPHLFTAAGGSLSNPIPVIGKAFSFCEAIPEEKVADRTSCYGGFGKEFIVLTKERDIREIDVMTPEQIKRVYDWCSEAGNEKGQNNCLVFAVSSMYWGGENKYDTALGLCNIIENKDNQRACFNNLIGSVFYYRGGADKDYLREFCNLLPEDIGKNCYARIK